MILLCQGAPMRLKPCLLALAISACTQTPFYSQAQSIPTEIKPQEKLQMKQAELQERGRKLRQFFEPYLQRANGKENWKFNIDFEKEAQEFFPVGMPFEDAIVVLKAAGLHILPRPLPREEPFKYWLVASLNFPNRYIYRTVIGVDLEPNEPRLENVTVKSSFLSAGVN
jgi:hypothetical protein